MNNPTQIFTNKAQDKYNNLKDSVDTSLQMRNVSYASTPQQLDKIKSDIFNYLWHWPTIEIDENPVDKDFQDLLLNREEASVVLVNYQYSSGDPGIRATMAYYEFNFKGSISALDLTVKNNRRFASFSSAGSRIKFFVYGQGDRNAVAAKAKDNKQIFLNLVKANQKDMDEFVDSNVESFKVWVSLKVDAAFNVAVKKNNDKNLL